MNATDAAPEATAPEATAVDAPFVRIVSDADGRSRFVDQEPAVTIHPAEHGVPELWASPPWPVDRLQFLTVKGGTLVPDWHTAPRRQFVTFLTGWAEIEVGSGEIRRLPSGSTVLVEDLNGTGHVTRHQPGDQRVLVVPLDP